MIEGHSIENRNEDLLVSSEGNKQAYHPIPPRIR